MVLDHPDGGAAPFPFVDPKVLHINPVQQVPGLAFGPIMPIWQQPIDPHDFIPDLEPLELFGVAPPPHHQPLQPQLPVAAPATPPERSPVAEDTPDADRDTGGIPKTSGAIRNESRAIKRGRPVLPDEVKAANKLKSPEQKRAEREARHEAKAAARRRREEAKEAQRAAKAEE